jgi:hypothetical protein
MGLGTLTTVTVHSNAARTTPPSRTGLRAGAVTAGVVLGSWVASAVAAPPEGWDSSPNDSMLVSLLKLLGIPLTVIVVVTLITYLPTMMRGGRGATDSSGWFAEHSEWFGGPRTTPEALESHAAASAGQLTTRGGAGARY